MIGNTLNGSDSMNLSLKDKVALVTGGSRGLGAAICRELAAEGAIVAINYRKNPEKVQVMVEELREKYRVEAMAVQGNIAIEADVVRVFKEVLDGFGTIDILVNNSGICPISLVKDMTLQEWRDVIDTNLTGTFLTCREMVKQLLQLKKQGKIVNIASSAAFIGSKTGKSHYAASKGGVVSFTCSLAREVAQFGIVVNAVAPGMMYTDMTAETLDNNMEKYQQEIPLGRIGEVVEVARTVCFLVSDAANYICGATVDISGGIVGR